MVMHRERQPPATSRIGVENDQDRLLSCEACGHQWRINPLEFACEHAADLDTWWRLAQRLICSQCGSPQVGVSAAPRRHFPKETDPARATAEKPCKEIAARLTGEGGEQA